MVVQELMSMRKISPRNSNNNGNTTPPVCQSNIVLLGSLGVGKSAITVRFITRRFIMEYDPCLEDTYSKQENIDGHEVMINIMDTYDREEISEADRYFKWADIVFIVYSITDRESYDKAKEYVDAANQYQRSSGRDLLVVLIGNKIDLERFRQISYNEGNAMASESDILFHETNTAEEYQTLQAIFYDSVRAVTSQATFPLDEKTNNASSSLRSSKTTSLKRSKSPRPNAESTTSQTKDGINKRNGSSFKLFNKSFKIFN